MSIYYEYLKNKPEFNFLYKAWKRFKYAKQLAPEWLDFSEFFECMVDAGWEHGMTIMRSDNKKPLSKDNFYLYGVSKEKIIGIKSGSKNSPCIGCRNNTPPGCASYRKCARYNCWIDKCWQDFRKAADVEV